MDPGSQSLLRTGKDHAADSAALYSAMALAPVVPLETGPALVFFVSFTDGTQRASTTTIVSKSLLDARAKAAEILEREDTFPRWVRIDWVDHLERQNWRNLREKLNGIKRNYFRLGISLDAGFAQAFTEMEINANAMLYGGPGQVSAIVNEKNFGICAAKRHGIQTVDFTDDAPVWLFTTSGVFLGDDGTGPHHLNGKGLNTGRRNIPQLSPDDIHSIISSASLYLASQVLDDGQFQYGWHPCFDRAIPSYNALRHASSVYSMLEAWGLTRDDHLLSAIERGLTYLIEHLIRHVSPDGHSQLAFVVEDNGEIKLGANAVAILALTKHAELTGDRRHLPLMEQLALGIVHMQNPETGGFTHVLNYPSLDMKQAFRIIYYDGEAAFGLMRLYALTGDLRWLTTVEKAFEHFIREDHWKAHDHWLSYCVNELTAQRPNERYYQFGIANFTDYLNFVETRITTFPTLLELMMAARKMVERIRGDKDHAHLLGQVDITHFYRALHRRAHYLLNGHFWPEMAMFFARPDRIAGSFFIRHHGFRVRIDDVEHYLSGLIAYREYLLAQDGSDRAHETQTIDDDARHWTAAHVAAATGGQWVNTPPTGWHASGLCIHPPTMHPGDMVSVRLREGERGISPAALKKLPHLPTAIITSDPAAIFSPDVPVLQVRHSGAAVLALGSYARQKMRGKLIGVTGSAGKTSTVAMLQHVLQDFGGASQTRHNANLPHGIAWNLASTPWDCPHFVLEMAIGKMAQNTEMARPNVALFTNVLPAHLEFHGDLATIAIRKSRIFDGMAPGSTAILNREMAEWERVSAAARARDLTIVTYGTSPDCDFRLLDYAADTGMVTAFAQGQTLRYPIGAAGEHMALNSLAVLAAVAALGHDVSQAVPRLESFGSLPGRGRIFDADVPTASGKGRVTVIDDAYNANPGSMAAAFAMLGNHTLGARRVAVLGEMLELGPETEKLHAELAPLILDHDVSRVHVAGGLYQQFWESIPPERRGMHASSPEALKASLRDDLRDGDLVLVKGSNGSRVHQLVQWLEQGAPAIAPHVSAMLFDCNTEEVLRIQGADNLHPPASLTKLMTLSLIDEKLQQHAELQSEMVEVSSQAADVNSRWGFSAGEHVPVTTLMQAAAIVSANEAAHALAEWHSGNTRYFTAQLNLRAEALGMHQTRFASPSGLGRNQQISLNDALILARHVQHRHPSVADMAKARSFAWNGKKQRSTNDLLREVPGANGLKTGRLGPCFNLIFSLSHEGRNQLAIVLGARSRFERDDAIRALLDHRQ